MSNPRHLWSGDWELDSAAAREELAKRRAQADERAEEPTQQRVDNPRPAAASRPAARPPRAAAPRRPRPTRPSALTRAWAWLLEAVRRLGRLSARSRRAVLARTAQGRQLRIALAIALVGVLSAGAAYAVTTMLVGSGGSSAAANSAHAWLGIDVTGSPLGIVVTDVVPGGPASKAGLQFGDMITTINNQPIGTVDAVNTALSGLHPGDKVAISFTRALMSYTTQATLAQRPPGYP
jgi:hypothetical protein